MGITEIVAIALDRRIPSVLSSTPLSVPLLERKYALLWDTNLPGRDRRINSLTRSPQCTVLLVPGKYRWRNHLAYHGLSHPPVYNASRKSSRRRCRIKAVSVLA